MLKQENKIEKSVIFIKNYLKGSEEDRLELQNAVFSSFFMKDFSVLCYAMWMVQNGKVESEIDEEYLALIEMRAFKYFVLPELDSLILSVSSHLSKLEERFESLMAEEVKAYINNKVNNLKSEAGAENPDSVVEIDKEKTTEDLLSLNYEDWSEELKSLQELQGRAYWVYSHVAEANLFDSVVRDGGGYCSRKLQLEKFIFEDVSDLRMQDLLNQKMLSVAENQTVMFNEIPLPCSGVEVILYLTQDSTMQESLIKAFMQIERNNGVKERRFRKVLNALPYLNAKSLDYIARFVPMIMPFLGEADKTLINYACESTFLRDELVDKIDDIFDFGDDDLDDDAENGSTDKIGALLSEVLASLPEEVSKKFKKIQEDSNGKFGAFLNLEFDTPEQITKEAITEKMMALISKLESDSHADIDNISDILYEWFSVDELEEMVERESKEADRNSAGIFNLADKMMQSSLKPKAIFTEKMEEEIKALKEELPNFSEAIDFIITEVKLNLVYNGKMAFTPVLLLGDAGLGKTYVAKEIARILNSGFEFIDFGSTSASWLLKGSSQQWKAASPGKILEAMIKSPNINPVILYDEIDKSIGNNQSYPPEVVLYQLFEKNNSTHFDDEFLGLTFDASSIINICTANATVRIPEPLMSRLTSFHIKKLSPEQTISLAKKMYGKMIKDYMIFSEELPGDMLDKLKEMTPREIDRTLKTLLINNTKSLSMGEILKLRKNKMDVRPFDSKLNKNRRLGL